MGVVSGVVIGGIGLLMACTGLFAALFYFRKLRLIAKGLESPETAYGVHGGTEPPLVTGLVTEKRGKHV
jgi:hypothetical protein